MSMIKIKYWKDSEKKKKDDGKGYSREQKPHFQGLEVREARGWRGPQEMTKEESKMAHSYFLQQPAPR